MGAFDVFKKNKVETTDTKSIAQEGMKGIVKEGSEAYEKILAQAKAQVDAQIVAQKDPHFKNMHKDTEAYVAQIKLVAQRLAGNKGTNEYAESSAGTKGGFND